MNNHDDIQKLIENSNNIENFIRDNRDIFDTKKFYELLNDYLNKNKMTKAEVAKSTLLYERYVYEIFSGKKIPSRDKLLQICLALKLNINDTNRLLNSAEKNSLNPRNIRDSIIIFSILKNKSVMECNEIFLEEHQTLFT